MAGNGQEGFMGYVEPSQYSQYGVLPARNNIGAGSPLNGQSGYVGGRAGGFLSGVQGGYNFEQQVRGNSRANADYNKTQEMQRTVARQQLVQQLSTPAPDPSDPMYAHRMAARADAQKQLSQLEQPQGQGGFLQTLGTAVQKIGQGAQSLGHAVAPGMISAPQQQQAPNTGTPLPQQGAPAPQPQPQQGALPTGAYANGGPVTAFSPSSTPQPSTPAGYADGGPIPPPAAPAQALPPQGAPQGAAPPPQGAPPQGAPPPQSAPAPQAPPGMPGNPGQLNDPLSALPPQAQDPSGVFNKFYQGLLDASLNDKGEPKGREPVPSAIANPNVAVQSTANNPAAARGIPEDSPQESNTPTHSLSSGWYDYQDDLAHQAAAQAAMSGHDPGAVYQAMTNMTTSFLQSHIMREASSAAMALQKGDMAGVEKSLKNMYYYVPDGQELSVQKQGGQLVYQNPIYPYLDAHNQPTTQGGPGATPNIQPVDAQHLSFLAQTAANPMAIGQLIQQARSAAVTQQTEMTKANAALVSAQGTQARGQGILLDAQTRQVLAPSQAFQNIARGTYYQQAIAARIQAAANKNDPEALKAGTAASGLVWQMAQGQPTTEPAMIPNPSRPGTTMPNPSPNAGRTTRDPTKVPGWAQGKNPDQLANIAGLAGEIAAANRGMPPQAAVNIAGTVYNHQGTKHPDPATGKPTADVKYSADGTQGWVWTGQNWQNFHVTAQTGKNLSSGDVDNIPLPPEDSQDPGSATPNNPLDPDPEESNGATPTSSPDDNKPAE